MTSKENKEKQTFKVVENYSLHNVIGSGTFGKVYKSTHLKQSGQYAIKVVPVEKFKCNPKLEECTLNEITILSNIPASPHIVKYIQMLKTANNFYFIYQYCNGGSLSSLLSKEGKLPEAKALKLFDQLLKAFKILNANNIMHRDVKPDNILFHDGQVKLGDFGFCKTLGEPNQMTGTMLGSPIYMAPEVLRGETYASKADIWSLGVVLYEMLFGFCPYQSKCIASLITSLQQNDLNIPTHLNQISPETHQLLLGMLCKNPVKRISWQALFAPSDASSQTNCMSNTQIEQKNIQRSSTHSKMGITPLEFGAKKKASSTSETNPSSNIKLKSETNNQIRMQSSKSELKCVTNTFVRSDKRSKTQKILISDTDPHKQCIKGLRMAMDLLKSQKQSLTNLLVYCIFKKIDINLQDLKQQNNSVQWRKIIESQQSLMNSQMTEIIPKLVEQGFTITHLINPQVQAREMMKDANIGNKQYNEICEFLGWKSPSRIY